MSYRYTIDYKVYSPLGEYLGLLEGVTSDLSIPEEINTAFSQVRITVKQNLNVSREPVEPIHTEDGQELQTEDEQTITTDGMSLPIGNGTKIKTGNRIVIIEYSENSPSGITLFRGYISTYGFTIGTSDDIKITCLSDGTDLDQYIVLPDVTVDTTVSTSGATYAVYGARAANYIFAYFDGAGNDTYSGRTKSNIIALSLYLSAIHATTPVSVKVSIVEVPNGASIGEFRKTSNIVMTKTIVVTGTTAANYDVIFDNTYTYKVNKAYAILVEATAATSGTGVTVYYVASGLSGNRFILNWSDATNSTYVGPGAAFRSVIKYLPDETLVPFTNIDISEVVKACLDRSAAQGLSITYTPASIETTGALISVDFQVNTILEAIQTCHSLAPAGWYWYVDTDNILHFKAADTTPDHKFVRGRHLEQVEYNETIEGIINAAYFTGGKVGADNLFVEEIDEDSIAAVRRGLSRDANNRITSAAVGRLLLEAKIAENNSQKKSGTAVIPRSVYDITTISRGQIASFLAFAASPIAGLNLQIVRSVRKSESVSLTLGYIPARSSIRVEELRRQLLNTQTIDNPNAPS